MVPLGSWPPWGQLEVSDVFGVGLLALRVHQFGAGQRARGTHDGSGQQVARADAKADERGEDGAGDAGEAANVRELSLITLSFCLD